MLDESTCPRGVCVKCVNSVLEAQIFKMFVKDSRKIWLKALNSLAELPESAHPMIKTLCGIIKQDTLSLHTLKEYNVNEPKDILQKLNNRTNKKKQKVIRSGPSCDCPDCGKQFTSPYLLNVHLINSGQKEACLTCGTVLLRGEEIKEHLSVAHKTEVILCKQCPLMFPDEVHMNNHVQEDHRLGALTCCDCGRVFARRAAFETHMQMHTVRTCRKCGAQFSNRGCYREHRSHCEPNARPDIHLLPRNKRSNIRDPAAFSCDHCGKTYTSRPQLKNHILWIHMDVRPHQCQWCGKRFYTSSRLAEHNVVHTRERKFECDICGVKLVSKMAVVYHRRRHTGEKPYTCEDCGEKFLSSSRRSEHAKRRHGKGVMMQCLDCPAMFARSLQLRKHIEKVHKRPQLFIKVKD
ncbi:zinc finger protein 91-like isoform X2 [Achroia grisella]|nr:zinc finger protein 91-like isoform X2 [Achroia grisella]